MNKDDTGRGTGGTTQGTARSARPPSRALTVLLAASLPLAGAAWAAGAAIAPGGGLAAAGAFALLTAAIAHGLASWPHPVLGPANLVSLARGALACLLVAALVAPPAPGSGEAWALGAAAAVALLLDGVDGALARRSGLDGPWGARLDMEVDSAFAALLAVAVLRMGEAGPWVLALGFLRYGFLLATLSWTWLGAPLPESRRRKAVCVVQIGALVAILSPVLDPPLAAPVAALAVALLVWSFAVDVLWLARR